MVENMEINMENPKENEKTYDILYPISLNEIFEKEKYKFEFVLFRKFSEEEDILEVIPEIIQEFKEIFKEIDIINMEDKKIIVIFMDITEINNNIKGFSIGKYFYNLKDHEYSEITSKYIQKNSIFVKIY
jgi:hypothetical protein